MRKVLNLKIRESTISFRLEQPHGKLGRCSDWLYTLKADYVEKKIDFKSKLFQTLFTIIKLNSKIISNIYSNWYCISGPRLLRRRVQRQSERCWISNWFNILPILIIPRSHCSNVTITYWYMDYHWAITILINSIRNILNKNF